MLTNSEIYELEKLYLQRDINRAKKHLLDFTRLTFDKFNDTQFHVNYYTILDKFAKGEIKRLIISCPPQHGKSEGSSRRLPAYILGQNPDKKVAIASYNASFARKFNRDIQRIIDEKTYHSVFPETNLNSSNVVPVASNFLRNADEFEIVGHKGGLKAVGRGGALTGSTVDVMIMDDLYKDYMEGNSPTIRETVIDWYTTVVKTRLHNDSQELIVFTRWHEDDLIGHIEKNYEVVTVQTWEEIETISPDAWVKINYEAIKTGEPTELDNRQTGEALYPEKHNLHKLMLDRSGDHIKFDALYQGNPTSKEGLLYSTFNTYINLPETIVRKNYTDTADTGADYLCSITYDVGTDGKAYVIDIKYTDEPMEITEPLIAGTLIKFKVRYSDIESNNGGRSFARKINEMTRGICAINWFHQTANKESRIISNAATVIQKIVMPDDWHIRWPLFYEHVTKFKRKFNANKNDDAPDVLTGIVEYINHIPTASPFLNVSDL